MGNVFMRKTEDVLKKQIKLSKKIVLKKNVDFSNSIFMGKLQVKKWQWRIFLTAL